MFAAIGILLSLLLLIAAVPQFAAQDESIAPACERGSGAARHCRNRSQGKLLHGLRPEDFVISEDKIPEKIATFEEGNFGRPLVARIHSGSSRRIRQESPGTYRPEPDRHRLPGVRLTAATSSASGANIFILFDTSNYMYRGFVFAQDAISDFVRSMDEANKIAFYSYSRDLSRATLLTADHFRVVNGVRSTVAGDDAALYNCLLLTVKDAAQLTGRRPSWSSPTAPTMPARFLPKMWRNWPSRRGRLFTL